MHGQVVQPTGWLQYVLPLVTLAVVFAVRARSMTRVRPLKPQRLWIVPAIYLVVVVGMFVTKPPSALGWVISLVALVVGVGIGWQRGRMMSITVDPETHALSQKGSPLAMLLLFGIVAVKMIAQNGGAAMGFDVSLLTDAALSLGLGMFSATRLEMYLRASRMLTAAAPVSAA